MKCSPESPDVTESEPTDVSYARAVGSRLRALRHQMGLSLRDVEMMSEQKIHMSVLGAYERGDRVITVPRLQRLARLYDLPVDQLLPHDGDGHSPLPRASDTGHGPGPSQGSGPGYPRRVVIDLASLKEDHGPEGEMLRRFLHMIQLQRQDFNGRMITIRTGDLRAIACLVGLTPNAMGRRLDDLGLLVTS